jgi:hypothetical protein
MHRVHAIPGHAPDDNFYLQKGFRYPLLCDACERFLNTTYESPFCRFWMDGQRLQRMRAADENVISDIDYAKFKLFHLSVLWRASVCLHPGFHRVSLGPHADRIRTMLLSQDPGPASLYPILCGVIIDDDNGNVCSEVIITPLALEWSGHTGYMFAFCGCQWLYFTPSRSMPEVAGIQLSERGSMRVDATSLRTLFRDFYRVSREMARRHGAVDARKALRSVPKR